MDDLFTHYQTQLSGNDEFKLFEIFFDSDLRMLRKWVKYRFKKEGSIKCDEKSEALRKFGNELYRKKHWDTSIEYYTKALSKANYNGEIYGLALANRSAVFFTLEDYKNCLKDIELCKKTKYPNKLRTKIYLRQLESYYELGMQSLFESSVQEVLLFLENSTHITSLEKEQFRKKIESIRKLVPKIVLRTKFNDNPYEIEIVKGGENKLFLSASDFIRLSYDTAKGRHVVAKKNLKRGDVIFVEKAFMFAPVYTDNYEIMSGKCYNCLSDLISCIPCQTCTLCLYCDEDCRDISWNDSHIWECKGVTVNLWYDLGIALPSLRTLLKGVKCGFQLLTYSDEEDMKKFGDKSDNYPFLNKLVTNIGRMSNVTPLLVVSIYIKDVEYRKWDPTAKLKIPQGSGFHEHAFPSKCSSVVSLSVLSTVYVLRCIRYLVFYGLNSSAVVVIYLQTQTNFFNWLIQQPNMPKQEMNNLVKFVGGLLTRHIAQLSCNSSVIQHWNMKTQDTFPSERIQVACGIYPSASMMNHSCKANVSMYFIKDVLIVKALDTILENEEIFNCYGVDYRYMKKYDRQHALRTLYDFSCTCEICRDPSLEFNKLDTYICPQCKAQLSQNCAEEYKCLDCNSTVPLKLFQDFEKQAKQHIEFDDHDIESIKKCYQIRKNILSTWHIDLDECLNLHYLHYLKNGDFHNSMLFLKKSLLLQQKRLGNNARLTGAKLFDALSNIVDFMKGMETSKILKYRCFPYEYFNSYGLLHELGECYNKLNEDDNSDSDYAHALHVWKEFNCKNLDIFESFRSSCLTTYGLDPAYYLTLPGYMWDAMLKHTQINLDLLTDVDMVMFVEKGIGGGLSKCSKANNKYVTFNCKYCNTSIAGHDPLQEGILLMMSYISYKKRKKFCISITQVIKLIPIKLKQTSWR